MASLVSLQGGVATIVGAIFPAPSAWYERGVQRRFGAKIPGEESHMKKRSIITLIAVFGALFLGLLIFIGVLVMVFSPDDVGESEPSIGVVELEGGITESEKFIEDLERFEDDDNIKGVIVRVDSPGGAVAPSQEMFYAIQRLADEKPLAVSMGTVAASGGYYAACGSETIFANPGTITGSIGVITQFFNVEQLVDRANVEVHTVKSGDFKDSGSPFREFTDDDEEYFAEMVFDIHDQFVEDVAECRDMEMHEVEQVADGRVFTGRQAYEKNLVDELGSLRDVVDYMADETGLDDPPVVYPPEEKLGLFGELFQVAVDSSVTELKDQTKPRVSYEYTGPQ